MIASPFRSLGLVVLLIALAPAQALAWGSTGHRLIGRLAVESLPADLPEFLHTPDAATEVGELAREPDRWRDAGKTHDSDRDPAHFLDLGDDGRIFGGPALSDLPLTRAEYETALRAAGVDSWKAGYLPYTIVDGWQQLVKEFAYLRIDVAGARFATSEERRAWLNADAARRRALILRDIGTFAHYVGDGSQPLHATIHFNGWGPFPNPEGFTQEKVHVPFEGPFVRGVATAADVRAAMPPPATCGKPIEACAADYLAATATTVIPFYRLQKAGAFTGADARGRAFVVERLGAGAGELRDLIVRAWQASGEAEAGWPKLKVADVEAGRVDPYDSLEGLD